MKLRRATPADELELERQLSGDFLRRTAPGFPRPDRDLLRRWLAGILRHDLVIVAEDRGHYRGSIALEVGGPAWSLERLICDRWIHVLEDPPSRAFFELTTFARAWAARRGLPLYLADGAGAPTPARARLWRRGGGELAAVTWRY